MRPHRLKLGIRANGEHLLLDRDGVPLQGQGRVERIDHYNAGESVVRVEIPVALLDVVPLDGDPVNERV